MASTFETLETSRLVELLEKQAARYAEHAKDGIESIEFTLCKTWIQLLQKEINARKPANTNKSMTAANIEYEENGGAGIVFSLAS
jgi:hypothetical protein